jgi:hypothetical protein
MATVLKAKDYDKWLEVRKAQKLEDTLRLISENLEYVADGLTAASNNWSDDYNYGHLTDEEVKMFEAWRQLINEIRN